MAVPDVSGASHGVPVALTRWCRLLLGEVDALADRLTLMILQREEVYEQLRVDLDGDLRATCRANLERTLTVLGGDLPDDVRPGAVTDETGTRRARQGVPLEVVLRAYRLCGRLLWERFRVAARTEGHGSDAALLEAADAVWRLIDSSSDRLVDAYRREEAHRVDRDRERRYAVLEDLLHGRVHEPGFLRDAAAALDLPEHGPVVCVVARHGARDGLHLPRETLLDVGVVSVWHTRVHEYVGLVGVPARGGPVPTAVSGALRRCATGPVGVSPPVEGLAHLDVAHRWARLAMSTLPSERACVVGLDERLPEALLLENPDLAGRLRRTVLGTLLDLPGDEGRLLTETLAAVLDADGSPSRAAGHLFCHRNTVMDRLRRIEALTGRRVSRPRDRLTFALALLGTEPRLTP